MKCSDIRFELPLFADGVLSEDAHRGIEVHLAQCPLCRQEHSDYQELRTSLRLTVRPQIPDSLVDSIRASVREALTLPGRKPVFQLLESQLPLGRCLARSLGCCWFGNIDLRFLIVNGDDDDECSAEHGVERSGC